MNITQGHGLKEPQGGSSAAVYKQRSPNGTVLYEVVKDHLPSFMERLNQDFDQGSSQRLPDHVESEFDEYLKCGLLEHGFVKLSCADCKSTILIPLSCKKRGFCPSCIGRRMNEGAAFFVSNVIPTVPVRQWVLSFPMPARFWIARNPKLMTALLNIQIRAVRGFYKTEFLKNSGIDQKEYKTETGSLTVIQRFGGALNLNVHFHTLFLDGVYALKKSDESAAPVFVPMPALKQSSIEELLNTIQKRMIRHLVKCGLIPKYENEPMPDLDQELTLLDSLQGASVQSKIGLGENQGQKVRRIGSFGFESEQAFKSGHLSATLAGFSLHAATYIKPKKRDQLETLCRYLLRPPVSEKRLKLKNNGDVMLQLKSAWSDGTYAMEFTPHEFIEKLIAIIPKPRIHGVRFHGILAPSAHFRSKVVPAQKIDPPAQAELFKCKKQKPKRSTWAVLLKRTFATDLTKCLVCGGAVKFQKAVLKKSEILDALTLAGLSPTPE